MPKTTTAKKALRQNIRHRKSNVSAKRDLKEITNKFKELVKTKNIEEAKKFLSTVYKALDKSGNTNLIKKNKASRLKSRLAKRLK